MNKSFEEYILNSISESEIEEWEELEKPFQLLVCSGCGFIAEKIVEHPDCEATLNDWWELNVKCIKSQEEVKK